MVFQSQLPNQPVRERLSEANVRMLLIHTSKHAQLHVFELYINFLFRPTLQIETCLKPKIVSQTKMHERGLLNFKNYFVSLSYSTVE